MKVIYNYKCEKCHHVTSNLQSIKEEILKEIPCEKCGEQAKKIFEVGGLIVPEHFQAMSDQNADHGANTDYISSRLRHSYPSGRKSKIYY